MSRVRVSARVQQERSGSMRVFVSFFLNDPPPPDISPLPLHDPLPICAPSSVPPLPAPAARVPAEAFMTHRAVLDRKSTRLNSSHGYISYAVFCLKQKI